MKKKEKTIICATCEYVRSEYDEGNLIHFCAKNNWAGEPERDGKHDDCEDYKQEK